MTHALPALPYPHDALAPYISRETLEYHHDKHHAAYVNNLNGLVPGTEFAGMSLEDIVRKAPAGGIFNNAAQIWNHTFYFNGMKAKGGGEPGGALAKAIDAKWGTFAAFKDAFTKAAVGLFGSGWTWLVRTRKGDLDIVSTSNAGCPLTDGHTPLLCIDVWEHAYYVDTRNARPKYVENWWHVVNWDFAAKNLAG
ncbi:MAG TPA: superoxide dismutase [Candidatus Krumholzibacteria bacterium]|nr:superoxide dismutase [Candidatus Krumholzibacteria bacterium]HPD70733.1 superoxide dismutase [Candidatus Krumholzibacteria bacterium]HRY39567.1 superoxide dismutase [Candidatus Krumholzibacteria bacterium]